MKKAALIAAISVISISIAHASSCLSDANQMTAQITKDGTIGANNNFYELNYVAPNPVKKAGEYCTDTGMLNQYMFCENYNVQWQSGNWGNTLTVTKYWPCSGQNLVGKK